MISKIPTPRFSVRQHKMGECYREATEGNLLVLGDALSVMSAMPAGCAQTVVTSPPYWSLRDYGIDGQIGL
ncbi:MAG TPA: hypothetical protein VN043_10925, partial [Rhodanobacter sp.]|nr:hypothetical protein [Rhodanobacter sp.]